MAAEMIQMLEGLNSLGAMPRPIRERVEPWRQRWRRPMYSPYPPYPRYPMGAREAGDGGPPLGALDNTVMSIVKFGAITAAAGGLLYVGAQMLRKRRSRSRRRR